MNKLVLVLTTVATLGLSTAAFAENAPASTPTPASTQQRVQLPQSQRPVIHKMRASHRAGAKKVLVVRHRTLHRGVYARQYGYDSGKKVVVKHVPANKTARTKASS
jgi:CubicO group peptidase (beta-lactamase class C family)